MRISREESNALDLDPEGPYMVEPLAADNWIAECSREVQEAEQRIQALKKIDLIITKVWALGKQLITTYLTASFDCLESITDNFS